MLFALKIEKSPPRMTSSSPDSASESGDGRPSPDDRLRLSARNLVKRYDKRAVVDGVSLRVNQGEIVGLLGPNGAGKTRLPMYRRARRGIGYLAQETSVFRELTVEDNIHAVLEFQSLSAEARRQRVEQLIDEFGLQRVRHSKGYSRPRFFLLDEPFAGVDPIAVEDIQEIVAGLKERGIGVLITDHNVHETLAITDRAYLLYEGEILKHGSAEELAADPEVRKAYLGEKFSLDRY